MRVSVIMTTFNGENYIVTQLNSLLGQTRQADEVLIYDDGSEDHTVEIIRKFINTNNLINWKLTINQVNKGWRRNFFDGICEASGDIVFPCDQDDMWMAEKIEIMENIMASNEKIDLLVSNYRIQNSTGDKICPNTNDKEIKLIPQSDNIFSVPYPGCTFCIRKELIANSQKYWKESFPHDAFFWRCALIKGSLFCVNQDLIMWRIHNDSTFSAEKLENKSIEKKIAWLKYGEDTLNALYAYLVEIDNKYQKLGKEILDRNLQWINLRKDLFQKKKIIAWIELRKYMNIYPQKKQYIFDLFYVLKSII